MNLVYPCTCKYTNLFTQQIEDVGPVEHLFGVKHLHTNKEHLQIPTAV